MKNFVKLADIKKLATSELNDTELSQVKGGVGPIKPKPPVVPCYGIPTEVI